MTETDDIPDEHAGCGGSYTVDPHTGRRTLIARTAPPAPVDAPAAPAAVVPARKPAKPAQPKQGE